MSSLKNKISQDLEALAEVVQQHHEKMGLAPEKALRQTQRLVKEIGHIFQGDRLYISLNERKDRNQRVEELLNKGLSIRAVAKRVGISKSAVGRIKREKLDKTE